MEVFRKFSCQLGTLVFLSVFPCGYVTHATIPQLPTKDISYEYSVSPTPELGKEFTFTVTIWFNQDTYYLDRPGAEAEARLGMHWPQEYVAGDTIVTGKFVAGERHTLTATYKAINRGHLRLSVTVFTRDEADAVGNPLLQHSYTVTTLKCGVFDLMPPGSRTKELILDSVTGLVVRSGSQEDLPDLPRVEVPSAIEASPNRIDHKSQKTFLFDSSADTSSEMIVSESNHLRIQLARRPDGVYQAVDTIRVSKDTTSRIVLLDQETRRGLRPETLTVDSVFGHVERIDDTTFLLVPTGYAGQTLLKGRVDDSELHINFEISSIWQLDGTFKYVDAFGFDDNRMESLTLKVYNKDYWGDWAGGPPFKVGFSGCRHTS